MSKFELPDGITAISATDAHNLTKKFEDEAYVKLFTTMIDRIERASQMGGYNATMDIKHLKDENRINVFCDFFTKLGYTLSYVPSEQKRDFVTVHWDEPKDHSQFMEWLKGL